MQVLFTGETHSQKKEMHFIKPGKSPQGKAKR